MPHLCPRTRRNVNRPIALAKPAAHDPIRPRRCHRADVRRRKTINYRIGKERVPVANALRGVRGAAKMDLSRTPRNATECVPYRRKSVTYCFTTR